MKTLNLLLSAVLFPMLCLAQSNYKPGQVVNLKGDTLKGFVDYREWSKNPESFRFKLSENDNNYQTFNTKTATAFGIKNGENYNRFVVNISLSKETPDEHQRGPDKSFKSDTVFLRLIAAGNQVNLYSYNDKIKNRFYIQKHNGQPDELLNSNYYDTVENNKIVNETEYRLQLQRLAATVIPGNAAILNTIVHASYFEPDLIKITDQLNGSSANKMASKSGSRFFAGLGVNIPSIKYTGDTRLTNAANKSDIMPKIDIGVDYMPNVNVGQFIIRCSLALTGASYNLTATDDNTYQNTYLRKFKQYTASLKPEFIYNVYNTNALKVHINAGVNINVSSYSDNKYYQYDAIHPELDEVPEAEALEKFWFSVTGGAGVIIKNRFEIYANYDLPSSVTNYVSYAGKVSAAQVGFHYLFGH